VGNFGNNASSLEKPITDSTKFDAILSAENGVPPVNSSALASVHFELKNDAKELTVPSFSLDGRELLGINAVHIHSGNSTENGPVALTLRDLSGSTMKVVYYFL
jgi:CHRD domain